MTEFLTQFGYLGMFISALLAGSVLPFNSEVVIGALKVMGLDPWILLIAGTVGNVLGGLFNYWIGIFGRIAGPSKPIANPDFAEKPAEAAPVSIFHYTEESPASLMPFLVMASLSISRWVLRRTERTSYIPSSPATNCWRRVSGHLDSILIGTDVGKCPSLLPLTGDEFFHGLA